MRNSNKRIKQEKEYKRLRIQYLQSHSLCQARISKECTLRGVQIHHKMGRIEELLNDTRFWLVCCPQCHNFIELNPDISKELGFSISRLNKE